MKVTLNIKPKAKARPRFGNGRAYTDHKTADYEYQVGILYRKAGGRKHYGAMKVKAGFYFATKDKRKHYHEKTSRPDVDNLLKALFDGLNEIAFDDDSQIVHVEAYKLWSPANQIFVDIDEVKI